jgi:hypothetical protein
MRLFTQHRRRAIVIGVLSILVITGLLLIIRGAQTLYDRQFSVPQKTDLAAVASAPAAYQDHYIQVEGGLRLRGFGVCEGDNLFPPGTYYLHMGGRALRLMRLSGSHSGLIRMPQSLS